MMFMDSTENVTTALRLTGIVMETGECHRCGRELGKVYQCSDGHTYGRKCIVKVTGWKFSQVEFELRRAQRLAEVEARRAIVAQEMPGLTSNGLASGDEVVANVVYTDCWWGGRGRSCFATWKDYVECMAGKGFVSY